MIIGIKKGENVNKKARKLYRRTGIGPNSNTILI